nr:MAG TPA: chitin synthase regulator [Caudoviricetes sp.]
MYNDLYWLLFLIMAGIFIIVIGLGVIAILL